MTLDQAKAFVARNNPNAVWVEVFDDLYEVRDFTYSDELRAVIFEFDVMFGDLLRPDGSQVKV